MDACGAIGASELDHGCHDCGAAVVNVDVASKVKMYALDGTLADTGMKSYRSKNSEVSWSDEAMSYSD